LQIETFYDLRPECFVTRFHVGEVQVCHHIRKQSEKLVADHVPEVDDSMGAAAHEARAEHNVGLSRKDGREKERVLGRVVLEIGILDENNVAAGGLESTTQGRTLSAIDRMVNHLIHESGHAVS